MNEEKTYKILQRKVSENHMQLIFYDDFVKYVNDCAKETNERNEIIKNKIFMDESILEKIINENTLFIIHPGWKNYGATDKHSINYMEKFEGYEKYLLNIKKEVKKNLIENKHVFVLYDVEKNNGLAYTKSLFEESELIIYVASRSNYAYNEQDYDKFFFEKLGKKIDKISICGEWTNGCLNHYIKLLSQNFKEALVLEDLAFPNPGTIIKK